MAVLYFPIFNNFHYVVEIRAGGRLLALYSLDGYVPPEVQVH